MKSHRVFVLGSIVLLCSIFISTVPVSAHLTKLTYSVATLSDFIAKEPVWNAKGGMVYLNPNKPVLFIAPWCPHCAYQEQLLTQWRIPSKDFQVVVLASWTQNEVKFRFPQEFSQLPTVPKLVNNVAMEKWVLIHDEKAYHLHYLNPEKVFYEPPNGYFDHTIPEYPFVTYKSKGKWKMHAGTDPYETFWKQVATS